MKRIKYKRVIVFCIIAIIPIIIHVFQSRPDAAVRNNLLAIVKDAAFLFIGSTVVAAFGSLIMFIAGKGVIWLLNAEKEKEPDLESLFFGLMAVVFCVAYYELLTGKIIGVI